MLWSCYSCGCGAKEERERERTKRRIGERWDKRSVTDRESLKGMYSGARKEKEMEINPIGHNGAFSTCLSFFTFVGWA